MENSTFILNLGLFIGVEALAAVPSESLMRSVGQRASNGDTLAIDKLIEIKTERERGKRVRPLFVDSVP